MKTCPGGPGRPFVPAKPSLPMSPFGPISPAIINFQFNLQVLINYFLPGGPGGPM